MKKQSKLTKLLMPAIAGITLACTPYISGCDKKPEFNQTYEIKSGDTLWDIATENQRYQNMNPHKVIYDIKEKNNIDNVGNLQSGQEIKLPEYN